MAFSIKFFLGEYGGPDKAAWATEAIALAQGLRELGVVYFANIDYWKDPVTQKLLFTKAPEGFNADCNVFFGSTYFNKKPRNLEDIPKAKVNVLLERNDELIPYWQRDEYKVLWNMDLVLITHYNGELTYPTPNVRPWQIGFTERMLAYVNNNRSAQVKSSILDTYRLHHNIRDRAISACSQSLNSIYPTERKITDALGEKQIKLTGADLEYWQMTGRRHNPDYYKFINEHILTYCYGGFYHPKPASNFSFDKVIRQLYKLKIKLRPENDPNASDNYYIYQWDSFRFWESLLSNSCPLFVDFESWKFHLPVIPKNWEHYIGVYGLDFESTANRIKETSAEELARISEAGRQWALQHYSPKAVAQRFLTEVAAKSRS